MIASVSYTMIATLRQQDRVARVRADLDRFVEACERFYAEYEMWPSLYLNIEGDTRYGTTQHPNREVIQALTGVSGPGNPLHRLNPARILFLDLPPYDARRGLSGLDANGDFLDPWGRPYQVVLDTDLDGRVVIDRSAWGAIEGTGVVIWSVGPDGISGTADDILSWE